MEEETFNTRSGRPEEMGEAGQADQWVKISKTQLTQLMQSLDDTRALLLNLTGGQGVPGTQRKKSWWGRHCWPSRRRFLYQNITLITVILQFLNLMMLSVIDVLPRHLVQEYKMVIASSTTMIALEVLNLFILILASGRLAKQVFHHNVNSFFLAQSYLATLLLFAGLYTLTYRLDRKSWKFLNENLTSNPIQVFKLYFKFLFYSISTATLCGSDNALPVDWYNHLFAGTQMLLSFCYFASILGMALSPSQSSETSTRTSPSRQREYHSSESSASGTAEAQASIRFLLSDSSRTSSTIPDEIISGFLQRETLHLQQQEREEEQNKADKCFDVCVDVETSDESGLAPNDILADLRENYSQSHQGVCNDNHQNYNNNNNSSGATRYQVQHHQQQIQLQRQPTNTWTPLLANIENFPQVKRSCSIQQVDEKVDFSRYDNVNGDDDELLLTDGCENLNSKP